MTIVKVVSRCPHGRHTARSAQSFRVPSISPIHCPPSPTFATRAAASAGGPSTPHHGSRRVRLVPPEPRPEIVPLPDHLADELLVPIILLAVPRERRRGDARDAHHAIRQLSCPPTRREGTQQKEEELDTGSQSESSISPSYVSGTRKR